jgi:hypothetical protein
MQIGFLQIWILLNSKIVIGAENEKGKITFFDTYFSRQKLIQCFSISYLLRNFLKHFGFSEFAITFAVLKNNG